MKKIILFFAMLTVSITTAMAQSEVPSDSINLKMNNNKHFGDYILNANLYTIPMVRLPSYTDMLKTTPSMENFLESLGHSPQWMFTKVTPGTLPTLTYGYNAFGFQSSMQNIGMGTIKLNGNLRLNLYGQYAPDGSKLPGNNLLPWEKNYFKGGMELKMNKNFGIRVEVQRGGYNPYAY